jgi:benzoyl-CoA-dihydrodiol lyase
MEDTVARAAVEFETNPAQYRHWKLSVEGTIATLAMDVREDAGLSSEYRLKLNSYDLAVDIELADAVSRLRFEHPGVRVVVITSLRDRVFSAGANIFMLSAASHAFKVNFCKFTNETRLAIEDASATSGIRFLAAVNGTCAGGGYELALACDEILLVDDGNSSVSLPEVPLLGVLPGTGGLTRLVDKRRVRRDRADVFSTLVEGIRGRRAVEWGLVDGLAAPSQFKAATARRAGTLAAGSARPAAGDAGVVLEPLEPDVAPDGVAYRFVTLEIDRARRVCDLTIRIPGEVNDHLDPVLSGEAEFWPLRAFRELDDTLLRLRFNEPEIGTIVMRTEGRMASALAFDRFLEAHAGHWFVVEVLAFIKRTLKRLDLTARSVLACIEPGSAFAGTLFELALAADRSYMLDDPDRPITIALSAANRGWYPMSNGLSRLDTRFLGDPEHVARLFRGDGAFDAGAALDAGLVTFAPDDLDWDDEVRLAIESRAAFSPDALTGLEANLRFPGPETMETRIFGRLSAWQNWIFQRPNAVGERGALKSYGVKGRPEFTWERT